MVYRSTVVQVVVVIVVVSHIQRIGYQPEKTGVSTVSKPRYITAV